MRNLTIKRRKKFVACLYKMKIYIEDAASCDLEISGVPCRFLGEIKNGEEVTFPIGNEEAKLFVIADKTSKEFCNELFLIPEGCDDIHLEGQNKYDLSAGNAFRFDNNETPQVAENRKSAKKRGTVIMIICIIAGVIIGLLTSTTFNPLLANRAKDFTVEEMTVTLTNKYSEFDVEGYTTAYGSKDIAAFVIREDESLFEGSEIETLEDYGKILIKSNGFEESTLAIINENRGFFSYEADPSSDGNIYVYYSYIYRSENAFWLIQFATLKETATDHVEAIEKYAASVTFSD